MEEPVKINVEMNTMVSDGENESEEENNCMVSTDYNSDSELSGSVDIHYDKSQKVRHSKRE